ncbi:MAG: hypothetical protein IJL06_04205, partial [Kiritimatiellae bacterium]|nr:hypothetical protein [Kiritimatiellia bacterium]
LANLATYAPGGTLAEQTEAYHIQCALYSGVSAATAAERIAAFRTLMLEEPETAQSAPVSSDAISSLAADATYVTYPEPKFTVSGSATLGSGTARVLVRYSLNSGAFDQTAAVELRPDGTFSLDIPYAAATNELVWFVEAEDFGGDEVQIERTAVSVLSRARDAAPVTYTWTGGAGDGKWTSLANWTCDAAAAYGYPLDASAAVFPAAAGGATIDLEGGTYSTSLSFADGAGTVGFRNGTLLVDAASAALGATGTTVEFGGVTVGNPSGTIALTFPGGLSVRDGTFTIQGSATLGDVVFTDGEAEARLSASGSLAFNGTCAMALRDAGRTAAFIEADAATAGSACTFELDVTDRSAAGNVPLATFASSQSANLSATLSTKIAGAAVANRGSLVWDGATLCYAQERQTGTATVPTAATGLVYNGAEQTGVPAGEGYTLSGTSAATAAGTYTATATLKDGYSWAGQADGDVQVQWSIARGANAWSPAPSISVPSWPFGAAPGVLTPGRTVFGEATATISRNGGPAEAFSGILPEEPGAYTVTYAAPEATADYAAPAETQQTVLFRIIAEPSGFDAYACYTTYPATFKIIGRVTPGSGETSVTVRYSLNSDSCGESMQAEIGPSGSFVCEIPYAN